MTGSVLHEAPHPELAQLATLACAVACAALVAAEWRSSARWRVASKIAASAAFLVVGACADSGRSFGTWILIGLAFGAMGDICLLGHGKKAFLGGLGAFLVGHLAYVGGLAELVSLERWPAAAGGYALLPLAGGGAALALLWPRLGKLRAPVIVYVAAIAAMVIGAIAAYRTDALPEPQRTWLLAGAALFFVSDLAVARDRFVGRSFANRLWGLPAYYAGQLLIAWAIS